MSTPTVFITNKSGHDFSAAAHFGDFVYLSEGSIGRYNTNRMYVDFLDILRHSKSSDYLLPTGLSTMNAIACCIFVLLHNRLNLLLFKDGRYVERTIVFDTVLSAKQEAQPGMKWEQAKALLKGAMGHE